MTVANPPVHGDLRQKREIWLECLAGKDRNSIKNQHLRLLWNVAAFRVINEARNPAYRPEPRNGELEINALMHGLLDECFFESQLIAIRRMTDAPRSLLEGCYGVWSLIALIKDIAANRKLFTREAMLEVEGRLYDYETPRNAQYEAAIARSLASDSCLVPVSVEPTLSEMRHNNIDMLAGVEPIRRSASDTLREVVLTRLESRVTAASGHIKKHVDKFVAHAATPMSRQELASATIQIKMGQLWDAHRVLHQSINFVGIYLLGGSNFGGVPHPIYDHLKFIDRPLVAADKVQALYDTWKQFEGEVHSWEQWTPKDLEAEINNI